jgi:hypothetical protein
VKDCGKENATAAKPSLKDVVEKSRRTRAVKRKLHGAAAGHGKR